MGRPRGSLRDTPRATPPGQLLAADASLLLAAAHSGHLHPAPLILAALGLLAGYALLCLVRPMRRCPRCQGKRVTERGERHHPCKRCRATGRTRRLGATTVHRFWWSALGSNLMARRRQRHGEEG